MTRHDEVDSRFCALMQWQQVPWASATNTMAKKNGPFCSPSTRVALLSQSYRVYSNMQLIQVDHLTNSWFGGALTSHLLATCEAQSNEPADSQLEP